MGPNISEKFDKELNERIENFKKENPTEWARIQQELGNAQTEEKDPFLQGFNSHNRQIEKLKIGKNKWFF